MKILHIFDDYGEPGRVALSGEGSISEVVYHLAKYTLERGYKVAILERDFGKLPREEEIGGIRYVRIKANKLSAAPYKLVKNPIGLLYLFWDGFKMAIKLNKFIKENEFDVVHIHFPFAVNILIHLNRKLRRKMVYTAHVGEEKKRLKLGSEKETPLPLKFFSPDLHLMKRVKKSTVLNEPLREKLMEKGISKENLVSIPNGTNVEDFKNVSNLNDDVRSRYEMEGKTVLMFAGTITPRKGVDYLIKAAEVLKGYKDILFLLVGNTSLDQSFTRKIEGFIKEKGLEESVKLAGFVPCKDLKALYLSCDVFVLPSLEEGFGMVLVDALALGKPLVGSNTGGIPMQIKEGWNGFLVEPANEEQLAEKIKHLIDHPEERERMGRNSRRLAEEFDWSKITERYLKVYKEVIG